MNTEEFTSSDSDFDLTKSLPRKKSCKRSCKEFASKKRVSSPVSHMANDEDGNLLAPTGSCSNEECDEEELSKLLISFDPSCKIVNFEGTSLTSYTTCVRSSLGCSKDVDQTWNERIKQWIESFSHATSTNWIVRTSIAEQVKPEVEENTSSQRDHKKLQFRKKYVCQHNMFNKAKTPKSKNRSRNLNCCAMIDVTVKFDTKHTRRNDKYIKQGLLAVIKIVFEHSHRTQVAEAFSFLRVDKETKKLFTTYFDDGLCAGSARSNHEFKLMFDSGDENMGQILANAQINPTARQVSYMYDQWRVSNFGGRTADSVIDRLNKQKERFKKEGIDLCIQEDPFIVVVLTPVMKRAHEESFSGEIVFIDSTGSCDQTQTCVTFIFTTSKIGALPLACILHQSQTMVCYEQVFAQAVEAIGPTGFGGCGYPEVIMTDDCDAERGALAKVFPASQLLLCSFHVSQALWRWIWDPKHKIDLIDRKYLMQQFREVLFEPDVTNCQERISLLFKDKRCSRYSNYIIHIETYWKRKTEWALCYRQNIATRGNNTNNIVESSIRILKEIVLQRSKSYNSCALVQFITNIFETYHKRKLLNYANSRVSRLGILYHKLLDKAKNLEVKNLNEFEFQVCSSVDSSIKYTVDIESESCECPAGNGGRFCKHLAAVSSSLGGSLRNSPALTSTDKALFAKIALGGHSNPEFYNNMVPACLTSDNIAEIASHVLVQDSSSDASGSSCSPTNEIQAVPSSFEDEINLLRENYTRILEMAAQSYSAGLEQTLRKMNVSLSKIKTVPQLQCMYYNGASMSKQRGILVQPTSYARRKKRMGFKCGARSIQAGRPSNIELGKVKRPKRIRNLGYHISQAQRNAKSHGNAH